MKLLVQNVLPPKKDMADLFTPRKVKSDFFTPKKQGAPQCELTPIDEEFLLLTL